MQLGASPRTGDPAEATSKFKTRATLTKHLEELGYESILVYEEVGMSDRFLSQTSRCPLIPCSYISLFVQCVRLIKVSMHHGATL